MDAALVGKTIRAILMDTGDTCVCFEMTDGSKEYYSAVGDCCAKAYYYAWQDLDLILGSPVTEVSRDDFSTFETGGSDYVIDASFYVIKTLRGRATFEFRVEHNGYYGGQAEKATKEQMTPPVRELGRLWEGDRPSLWDHLDDDEI